MGWHRLIRRALHSGGRHDTFRVGLFSSLFAGSWSFSSSSWSSLFLRWFIQLVYIITLGTFAFHLALLSVADIMFYGSTWYGGILSTSSRSTQLLIGVHAACGHHCRVLGALCGVVALSSSS